MKFEYLLALKGVYTVGLDEFRLHADCDPLKPDYRSNSRKMSAGVGDYENWEQTVIPSWSANNPLPDEILITAWYSRGYN